MNRNDAPQDERFAPQNEKTRRIVTMRRVGPSRAGGDQRNGASSLAMAAAFAALIISSSTYCGGMT